MLDDVNLSVVSKLIELNETSISFWSAIAALIAAIAAILSWYDSKQEREQSKKTNFVIQYKNKLDECYLLLNSFVEEYTTIKESSNKKKIARDKLLYLTEALRDDLKSATWISDSIENYYGDITIKISDMTYENNFEKNIRDLGVIKNNISELKQRLI